MFGPDTESWNSVRRRLRSVLPAVYPVGPNPVQVSHRSPPPGSPAACAVCRGPVRPGFARCYQCGRHGRYGPGLLADAVVPISYAVKGTDLAADLWRYKSWRTPSASARAALLALLLTFLHDHGPCIWRRAGMAAPGRLAVVPTGCGRPGPHPLLELASPYLRLPPTRLAMWPGRQGRDLDIQRFNAERTVARADVLLIDDTWVSGAALNPPRPRSSWPVPGVSRSWSSAVTSTRSIPGRPSCWPRSGPARTIRPNVRYIPNLTRIAEQSLWPQST
jgi:hypothetical protein